MENKLSCSFKVGDKVIIKPEYLKVQYYKTKEGIPQIIVGIFDDIIVLDNGDSVFNYKLEIYDNTTLRKRTGTVCPVYDEFNRFQELYCHCLKPDVINNAAGGVKFKYCRSCKKEKL